MRKLLPCKSNMDTACVELKFADDEMVSIDCMAVEDEIVYTIYQQSELGYLAYDKLLEYTQLALGGDLEKYV